MRRDQIREVVENALSNTPKNATQDERIRAIVEYYRKSFKHTRC